MSPFKLVAAGDALQAATHNKQVMLKHAACGR
jgi:hypothetical protein